MTLIHKDRWSLLSGLTIATLVSCGSPSHEPEQPAEPSAPFRQTAAQVVSGEVAAFKATSANAGIPKNRDTAGSLPSIAVAGKSAAYAPDGGQEPSISGTPPARIAKP